MQPQLPDTPPDPQTTRIGPSPCPCIPGLLLQPSHPGPVTRPPACPELAPLVPGDPYLSQVLFFVRAPRSPDSCPGPQGPPPSSKLPLPVLPLIVPGLHHSYAPATPKCPRCHSGCSFCNSAIHFPPLPPSQPPMKHQHLFEVST